jgi:hypothetical protein
MVFDRRIVANVIAESGLHVRCNVCIALPFAGDYFGIAEREIGVLRGI